MRKNRITVTWRNGWLEKKIISQFTRHQTTTLPQRLFFKKCIKIILGAKWLVRHSITSPQLNRSDDLLQYDSTVHFPKGNRFSVIEHEMYCSGENVILREIFHVVSCFPLHFMLYKGNLDYFLTVQIVQQACIQCSTCDWEPSLRLSWRPTSTDHWPGVPTCDWEPSQRLS